MSNTSILATLSWPNGRDIPKFPTEFNPFRRFYADLTDHRDGNRETFLQAPRGLESIIGGEPARFINEIGLLVQVLPGTPVTIDNAHELRGEFDSIKDDPSLRGTLPIFDLVSGPVKEIYLARDFNSYPMSKAEWDAMSPDTRKNFQGWNGYNFHIDSVAIAPDGHVSITLKLTPNKLLDAEMLARKEGFVPDEYSARQFHSSVICICQDEKGKKYLVVQAKNIWANNGGDVELVDSPDEELRLYHPALVAGGVEPQKFFASDDQKLVANPGLFGALDQASHEIGIDFRDVYRVSDPVALLHEGISGESKPNKLPASLYCNIQHVMQREDGKPISIGEIQYILENYGKNVSAVAQGSGPEMRGCAFIPLEDGHFSVVDTRDKKKGNQMRSLCVSQVKTMVISPKGEVVEGTQDVILDSAYTGILKHLLTRGDSLRELAFAKAGFSSQ